MRSFLVRACAAAFIVAGATAVRAADPDPATAQAAQQLFARAWEWSARSFPEFATYRGDLRFNDRWTDMSPEAQAARDREIAAFLAEARALPREKLSPLDRVSLEMFIEGQQRFVELAQFPAARGMSLRALGGPQSQLADLMQVMPTSRPELVQQIVARMNAWPRRLDQDIASLRKSAAGGWIASKDVLQRVLQQIDSQLSTPPDDSAFFAPFKRLPASFAPADREALQAAAREAIRSQVLPALQRLRALVAGELLPRAPAEGAYKNYPDGERVYAMAVRRQTTTELTPAQIHAIGQRELTRLRGEMEAVMKQTQFSGSFAEFVKFLNADPRFFHPTPEALLAGYREIAKRIDAELPKLFAELPRAPYGVRSMPAYMGPDRAEFYTGPALDGTRAGFFNANTLGYKTRPVWGMETLVAHEAAPGHHLQIARAVELRGLPEFRRGGFGYTAYVEGWALYAETLGFELGLYTDPYSRFGHLQWQAFRAARLVADTGIHALGWTKKQAVEFMIERTGVDADFVASEVDRYTSDPGQALAYMIGKLKFDELRDRAKAKLGARFDIRRFHNAVLDQGALPLSVLERVADEWIASQGSP